jgi:hypothetical protein
MLADVRPLRQNGIRLPRERIDALPPVRGELLVFKRMDPWRNCSVPVASLVATDQVTYVLPPLDQVRIARWQGADLVLVGLEEAANIKGERPNLQSWWVHLVSDRGPPRTSPPASVE